ncbi:MAG: DUF389 domain-containing protein [Cyclobacteriaceae bacterium]
MEKEKKQLHTAIKDYFGQLFDLHDDKERASTTIADIKKGVVFRGANLYILIFAIFIASIGLNVNSTAVIIGAMLISPLMGPIMGIGLGAGINDFDLIKTAFKNLGTAVLISVLTSTLYFYITPLHEAQSELLSRTYPTLWDVMIALFGGLAGIVAGSRREKSNAIPGVAIATALMPPLCTAGYGLANGNWEFFIGAFYLFFINSVFISVATFLIVRFLRYPKKKFTDPAAEKRVRLYISFFVVITIVPSIYLAYNLVRKTLFEQQARNFVAGQFNFDETTVIGQDSYLDDDQRVIEVTLYGKTLTELELNNIEKNLRLYNLENSKLKIRQGYHEDNTESTNQAFEQMSESLKLSIIEDLYKENQEKLMTKDAQIQLLEHELFKLKREKYPVEDISTELEIQYDNLEQFLLGDMIAPNKETLKDDTVCYALLKFSKRISKKDQQKLEAWLKARTKADSLQVVVLN